MITPQGHSGKIICTAIHAPPAVGKPSAEHPLIVYR
jgi:hypothetical protein